MSSKPPGIEQALIDPGVPVPMRVQMLKHLCQAADGGNGSEAGADAALGRIVERASAASGDELLAIKVKELASQLEALAAGPLRVGTYVQPMSAAVYGMSEGQGRRAEIVLPDGTAAFCAVPDKALAETLRCGDTVWLEAQLKAVLGRSRSQTDAEIGEQARLERVLPGGRVEVDLRDQGRYLYRASARLEEQLASGEVSLGSSVIVCPQRRFAFAALPRQEGRFNYLVREPVPDVVIERDIGNPPDFLEEYARHMERELTAPEIGRRHSSRRSRMHLLKGVPGTGKTYCILGLWNRMYALMSRVTGAPVEALPPRVMRLEPAGVLDRWVGSSDRNIARFFDEIDELSAQRFVGPDGREHELPCLVIAEEVESLARERGGDPIYDRIQSTLLTRLDSNLRTFSERLVLFLFTTNTPNLVDPAFLRRAGGTSTTFDRMDRATFRAVLGKHLARRPFAGSHDPVRTAAGLEAWLFAPESEPVIELVHVGESTPVRKQRRDFLTAALIDRAVQQACNAACDAEWRGARDAGLTPALLARAIEDQVRTLADVLTPQNAARHLSLPDGVRVGTVRRFEAPALLPAELERDR